jgi:hypothetical protein
VRNLLSCGVAMVRGYYLCIMASKGHVIHVGMTGLLMERVLRHKAGTSGAFTRKFAYTASRIWRVMRVATGHSLQVSNSLRLGLANSLGFSHPKDHNNTSDESVELGCVLN